MELSTVKKKKNKKIFKIISTFFFMKFLFIFIGIPLIMALLWSLVDPQNPWSYKELFPKNLSFHHWVHQIKYTNIGEAIKNSFIIAILSSIFTFIVALPTSFALGRFQFKGSTILRVIVLLPMILPGMTIALFLGKILYLMGLSQTYIGIVIGHTFLNLPFMITVLTASFKGISQEVVEASSILGAGMFTRLKEIYFPLVLPGLFAGTLFTFISSIEEFNISFIIGAPTIPTIPGILYSSLGQNFLKTQASVTALILIIPNIILLIITESLIKDDYIGKSFGKM